MATDPAGQTSARLRAALAGDTDSLGWLVHHLSPLLCAQARWRLAALPATACDPDDLVQEAWLALLPRLPELAPRDGRLTPVVLRFLSTAIVHRVNNLARAALRRGDVRQQPYSDDAGGVPDHITGVITAAVRAEHRRLVLDAIEALDPIDRAVLLLRGVEQRSGQATAELLAISVDAVAMRFGRARQRLRTRLPDALLDELG